MTQIAICRIDMSPIKRNAAIRNNVKRKSLKKCSANYLISKLKKKCMLTLQKKRITRECRKQPTFNSVSNVCNAPHNTSSYIIDEHYAGLDSCAFDTFLTETESEALMKQQFLNLYSIES